MDSNLWLALAVFVLRIFNNALTTLRFVAIARGMNTLSSVLAVFESLIFAFTVANVVNDLTDPIMLSAYSLGFGIGSYVGLWLERRFVQAFFTVNVVARISGHEIALALREAGFGVTETRGKGRDGAVTMLRTTIDRRDARHVTDIVRQINPEAFIAMDEARSIRQGYFRQSGGILR
jgi:uncharacterized protein YebE (UPF0316 family)